MSRLLDPSNTTFVLLSFEGPDAYAQAGGLGVRVQGLSLALAEAGYPVHLFFVGDPMAAGRVAFTGQTGEEYVRHLQNAVALQTDDPDEAAWYVTYLEERPPEERRIRQAARETARRFVWEQVVEDLLGKVEFLAERQGALPCVPIPEPPPPPQPVLAGT